ILEPVVREMAPNLLAQHPEWHVHVTAWHAPSFELLMTLGVIVFGIFLFMRLDKWKDQLYNSLPRRFSLNNAYDKLLDGIERLGANVTRTYMTGSTTHYLSYIFGFLIISVLGTLLATNSFHFNW